MNPACPTFEGSVARMERSGIRGAGWKISFSNEISLVILNEVKDLGGGPAMNLPLPDSSLRSSGGAILLECLGHTVESDRGGAYAYIQSYAESTRPTS